jgi:hypothetical protein
MTTQLDPQLVPVIEAMKPIVRALADVKIMVDSGKCSAAQALAFGKKQEKHFREGRAAILSERGEQYACLLDPLIDKAVEFNREMERKLA